MLKPSKLGRRSTTTSGGSMALAICGKMSSDTFRSAGGIRNQISIPKSSTLPEKPGRITNVSRPSLKNT
jgi:hypothetical protein